jgi:hypothetical protein
VNRHRVFCIAGIITFFLFYSGICAAGEWEGGTKIGFDSNINRIVRQEKSDSFLLFFLAYNRMPTGESRLDWIFGTNVEGAVYNRYKDISYGLVNIAPGFSYSFNRIISASVSPFLEAKVVKDNDQSAFAAGGKIMFRERLTPSLYLGQYYLLRANVANVETYSYTENAFGILVGGRGTERVSGEIGYEYSRGDSFRALPAGDVSGGRGRGSHQIFSRAFDETVIRESVDRNAIGISININWNGAIFTGVNYIYASLSGDSGTSHSHSGFIDLGYRF